MLGELERSQLQQVPDAQAHLVCVERLGKEVPRAARKRLALQRRARFGGEHEHWHRDLALYEMTEAPKDREAIRVRHVEVEQHEVWRVGLAVARDASGVRQAGDAVKAPLREQQPQQRRVWLVVVDHEDPHVLERRRERRVVCRH